MQAKTLPKLLTCSGSISLPGKTGECPELWRSIGCPKRRHQRVAGLGGQRRTQGQGELLDTCVIFERSLLGYTVQFHCFRQDLLKMYSKENVDKLIAEKDSAC